ncbi:hypothetical protein IPL44_01870 [Candidatus Saccharibacteria bacterium]|nr:MAG: hypothetical protein IPL44_01870 [Candidatus Saccharibacteria bacterium]
MKVLIVEDEPKIAGALSRGLKQEKSIVEVCDDGESGLASALADEPTGNLDATTGKMIFGLLHQLSRAEHVTIVVVTHDLDIAGRTDVSFQLRDGKLVTA